MLVPSDVKEWSVLSTTFSSGYFFDFNFFVWLILVKLLTLLILTIWYMTCQYRWRISIVIPICFEFYKIITIIYSKHNGFEEDYHYVECILISIPYVVIVTLLSNTLGFRQRLKFDSAKDKIDITDQLKNISKFDPNKFDTLRSQLILLKKSKPSMTEREYLIELIAIKDQL